MSSALNINSLTLSGQFGSVLLAVFLLTCMWRTWTIRHNKIFDQKLLYHIMLTSYAFFEMIYFIDLWCTNK